MWDTVKALLRGKCIAVKAYIKIKKDKINYLTLHLKELKKETMSKTIRRKEIVKIIAETNERIENQ